VEVKFFFHNLCPEVNQIQKKIIKIRINRINKFKIKLKNRTILILEMF